MDRPGFLRLFQIYNKILITNTSKIDQKYIMIPKFAPARFMRPH